MSEEIEADEESAHLYRLFYGDLRICGCGNPEEVYALVRDLLALAPFYEHQAKVAERIGLTAEAYATGDLGPYYMVLYALSEADLIEHGGSVGGSWLTAKGAHYLELMKRHEWEDLSDTDGYGSEVGYPHDGADCLAGCLHHHDPATVKVSRADLEAVYDYARLFSVHKDYDAASNPSMIRVRSLLGIKP